MICPSNIRSHCLPHSSQALIISYGQLSSAGAAFGVFLSGDAAAEEEHCPDSEIVN